LLERELLSPRQVLDEGVRTRDASRSHSVSLVEVGATGGFAVKWANGIREDGLSDIAREQRVYRLASSRLAGQAVVPQLFPVPSPDLLVLGLVVPGDTVTRRLHASGGLDRALAAAVGEALGAWHGAFAVEELVGFPGATPWVFDVLSGDRSAFPWDDPGLRPVLEALPHPARFRAGVAAARGRWRRERLIHGDLRWDNCLVEGDPAAPRVRLIDWEMADAGDPAWDIGGVLQECLAGPSSGGGGRAARLPAAAAAWEAYADAGPDGDNDLLERSVAFAGVRLIQTTLEWAGQSAPPATIASLLEASLDLIEAPERTAAELRRAAA
jgi:hypothetical protein